MNFIQRVLEAGKKVKASLIHGDEKFLTRFEVEFVKGDGNVQVIGFVSFANDERGWDSRSQLVPEFLSYEDAEERLMKYMEHPLWRVRFSKAYKAYE